MFVVLYMMIMMIIVLLYYTNYAFLYFLHDDSDDNSHGHPISLVGALFSPQENWTDAVFHTGMDTRQQCKLTRIRDDQDWTTRDITGRFQQTGKFHQGEKYF